MADEDPEDESGSPTRQTPPTSRPKLPIHELVKDIEANVSLAVIERRLQA